jgi:hypothetical protein
LEINLFQTSMAGGLPKSAKLAGTHQQMVDPLGKVLPSLSPDQVGLCPQRTSRVMAVLQAEVDRQRLPGAVILIARHG